MSGKLHFFNKQAVTPKLLMAHIAEDEDVDGVVICVRRNGAWETCWSAKLNSGSLCMAAMAVHHDVTLRLYEDDPEDEGVGQSDEPA